LWSPHDLRHQRISLLHLRGVPWARIAELVGQRDLTVTANTYTHVLSDETELDYANLPNQPVRDRRVLSRCCPGAAGRRDRAARLAFQLEVLGLE
jgi:hypothetical protein